MTEIQEACSPAEREQEEEEKEGVRKSLATAEERIIELEVRILLVRVYPTNTPLLVIVPVYPTGA